MITLLIRTSKLLKFNLQNEEIEITYNQIGLRIAYGVGITVLTI